MVKILREVTPFKVKYNDVFHLKNLYVMMHEYLVDEGWYGDDGLGDSPSNTHRDIEKLYMERHHQKSTHKGGMELWLWWRMKKHPFGGKVQGYYQYHLDIDFHGMYMQKIEIMHQGKKLNVDKGELEIFFRPKLVRLPAGDKWADHWFMKHFQGIYEKRIMSTDFDKLEKELWREAYRLQGTIKAYLNLRNFIPIPEPFHPKLYGMEAE
ncbi:hypothetical protein GOV09_04345, partial [Candidatus Woesearchaeota archaeon]|nr:hypothetical protein [Candidatus Woesearchaeota archaeon]